jgi:hypothetical protein
MSPKEFFAQEKTPLLKAFYSEDYIVHKLRSGETPEILANLFLGSKGSPGSLRKRTGVFCLKKGGYSYPQEDRADCAMTVIKLFQCCAITLRRSV